MGWATGRLRKVRVISIIDDDKATRLATQRLVRSLGYAAVTYASAEEFLNSAGIDDTACLITDVQMPGMSGLELQTRLIAEGRGLPVIFMSAFGDAKTRARAFAAGAIGFLDKPFGDATLIEYLEKALSPRR